MRPLCLSLVLLSLSALAAEPAAKGPLRLAAPGLVTVNLSPELASFYAEHLGQKLAFQGLKVVTAREIQALIGLERQKQLLGCSEDNSCLVDIAGALGADALLVGDVAKLGSTLAFNLRILSARDGDRLAAFTAKVDGEEAALPTLDRAAELMAADMAKKLGRQLTPTTGARSQQLSTGPRAYAWMPAAAGLALAGTGTALMFFARERHLRLTGASTGPVLTGGEADQLRRDGATFQTLGISGIALGAVGFGAAAALYFMGGGESTVQTGIAFTPEGGTILFSGVIP